MKLFNNQNNGHNEHDHTQNKGVIERVKEKLRDYLQSVYCSNKCKKMSRGSYCITRSMGWARGDGWRRNHPKSLNKKH